MEHAQNPPAGHGFSLKNIKWGAIIAGAAVVAGAVLFAPDTLTSIGGQISEFITGLFTRSPDSGPLISEGVKKLAGAVLLGGGATYFLTGHHKQEAQPQHQHADSGWVDREAMRVMQGKMMMQAAAAGNPQAQAMMQQGMGR